MSMSDEAKKARREYLNNWRRNNPDKVKQHTKNFWEKKAKEEATD